MDGLCNDANLRLFIGYLRNKIDKPYDLKLIHTRRGAGYQMSAALE